MVTLESILVLVSTLGYCSGLATAYVSTGHPPDARQFPIPKGKPLLYEHDATTWYKASTRPVGNLEDWIDLEKGLAFQYLLDNIAPNGANTEGCADGTVIASPSKDHPNYFYQWIRDAAITVQGVIDEYERSEDLALRDVVDRYADIQGAIQATFNPSGGFSTGGLGEPKFMVDGAPFTGSWARPQRDGPALRALTLMNFIRVVNQTHPELVTLQWISRLYNPDLAAKSIVKSDLEYVSHHWDAIGFDLWEEIQDSHFFTALVQHKALVQGRDLALSLDDHGAAEWYDGQQVALKKLIKTEFWDGRNGHLKAYQYTPHRTGLDCSIMLGSIHGGQKDLYAPWSDEVLASTQLFINQMQDLHPINKRKPPYYPEDERLRGAGIGRYVEDTYDGVRTSEGNPWFLCTSSVSSIFYTAIAHFIDEGEFRITRTNRPFFNRLHPAGRAGLGRVSSSDPDFRNYLQAMFTYADSFLNVIRYHAKVDGRLSEQFDKYDGFQRGAHDLTWSYGSFLMAADKRQTARGMLFGSEY
ncbi:Glycoside Hydrolase Family 15 protein [Tuber magnatum]|uniref:glucan 1,4-alpha-glucosidase n=1 Tax=Tuber magnatum TaxID=42249 RepID=A0A317STF6_9PEZI|nr:Glycoside Hydrolase Family 15 protein [Tuber magnatum]